MDRYNCKCWQITLGLFVVKILFLSSCTDDMADVHQVDRILFATDVQNSWNSLSNPQESGTRSGGSPIRINTYHPLYLHTLYDDGINSDFSTALDDTTFTTRSTPVNGENMYPTFGVSAYAYTNHWDETQTPDYMYNVSVNKTGNLWSPSSAFYWPGENYKIRFFAYAPKETGHYRLSGPVSGSPAITCTIPENVADQQDLLVAASGEINGTSNTAVNLTFRHALTAVRFVCGNDMKQGVIKSITMKGVNSTGTFDFKTNNWINIGTPKDFSQTLDKMSDGGADEPITTPAQTFMMIPQTLPDNAVIELVFSDGDSEQTLTGNIAKGIWPMGKTITYKISASSTNWTYTFEVTPPNKTAYTFQGGSSSYGITSYKEDNDGNKEAVSWKADFSVDGGKTWSTSAPDWMPGFTSTGDGSEEPTDYYVTISPQRGNSDSQHTKNLKGKTSLGTKEKPYNLSNAQGEAEVQNTANCYVISAPGEYSFPLVYGNAIKDAKDNKSAYSCATSDENVLQSFLNHLGQAITAPRIYENSNCQAKACKLLWQDAPVISNVSLYNDGKAIRFTVDPATIQQGNALIAVYDSYNSIMWSWHIWVTDNDVLTPKTVMTNYADGKLSSQMMPFNLGWCDGESITFAKRECLVRITAGSENKSFTLTQNEFKLTYLGNNPYYQWGRKDPLYPVDMGTKQTKYWYEDNGSVSNSSPKNWFYSQNKREWIADGITNPQSHNTSDMNDKKMYVYFNLWDSGNTTPVLDDSQATKSIYDPCPVGYRVPRGWEFNGFSKTGSGGNREVMNVSGTFANGWNFYCGLNGTGETIFFPATGARFGLGITSITKQNILSYGSAVYNASNAVFQLYVTNNVLYIDGFGDPTGKNNPIGALPIRPVREQ